MRARQLDITTGRALIPPAVGSYDKGRGATKIGYIALAATFTNAAVSNDGGLVKLTSAGAHGLTAAVAVGKHIYVSAGTNWTAGFYAITALDLDTTGVAVTINLAYSASLGVPTIALANTEVTFKTVQIPPLGNDSYVEVDVTYDIPSSTNAKNAAIRLGGTSFFGAGVATTPNVSLRPANFVIQNRGATNSQVTSQGSGFATQAGITTVPTTTGSVDTSVPTLLTIGGKAAAANEYMYLERYTVKVTK